MEDVFTPYNGRLVRKLESAQPGSFKLLKFYGFSHCLKEISGLELSLSIYFWTRMTTQLARDILSHGDIDTVCQIIFDHEDGLVWDEHGDEVERFNAIAALFPGIPTATIDGEDDRIQMTYGGATVAVPVEFDREDNLRAVHTLGQLSKADLEFRLCKDTSGNSEQAFLLLPPLQWKDLEREFGHETVARRFLALDPSYDSFIKEAFAESEEGMPAQQLAVKRCAEAVEAEANKYVPNEIIRGINEDSSVDLYLTTETDAERDRLSGEAAFAGALKRLTAPLQAQGLVIRHVTVDSRETPDEPVFLIKAGQEIRQSFFRLASAAIARWMR